ncbi:MAG: TIR domain-containing protein, partial [Clostridia bacterium]|nr:TIR domain-containing protein [Clostridia bacterium]
SNDYERLENLLREYPYFRFKNYSVPQKDPFDISGVNYKAKLRTAITEQMRNCSCLLVIAGKYASYSDSIDMELQIAISLHKPIIAIEPWGATMTSQRAKEVADRVVGWNAVSVVNAIKELCTY